MDEFTRKRYDKAAEEYIEVLLSHGLLEASDVLRRQTKSLQGDELSDLIRTKLREHGYQIKGERHEPTNTD